VCCRPGVAEYLAAIDAPLVITPWRSVLVCDLDEGVADASLRVLAPMGLVFDEHSRVAGGQRVVRAAPAAHIRRPMFARMPLRRSTCLQMATGTSWGCERACGSPPVGEVLVATGDGYQLRTPHP